MMGALVGMEDTYRTLDLDLDLERGVRRMDGCNVLKDRMGSRDLHWMARPSVKSLKTST